MASSSWKPNYLNLGDFRTLAQLQSGVQKSRSIFIWSKASVITPGMVGLTAQVYDGRQHVPVYVTDNKIGYKFGHFVTTRTFRSHIKKDKRGKR